MLTRNPILYLLVQGWKNAGKYKGVVVLAFILFAGAQAIELVEPYVIGCLINSVQKHVESHSSDSAGLAASISQLLLLFISCQVGFWAFHAPARLLERIAGFQIRANYRTNLFSVVTRLPLKWHKEHQSGDTIDKINKASTSLGDFFENTFEVIYMLLGFFGSQLILLCYMPAAAGMAIGATVLSLTTIVLFDRVLCSNYLKLNSFSNVVSAAVYDYVGNIVSVITLRLEERVTAEMRKRIFNSYSLFKRTNALNEGKWFITGMITALMTATVMYWYVHSTLLSGGKLEGGTLFTLFEYLRRIGSCFFNFAYVYGTVVSQATDVRSAEPLVADFKALQTTSAQHVLPQSWQNVSISSLFFAYEDEDHRVHHVDAVSLDLKRGHNIALVGESGSGKSTLLSLLRGVQTSDRVEVICDGDILPGKLLHLSGCTTLIPQDAELFADTLRFNITFGVETSEEDLDEAVRNACFDSVLLRLADGLETNIAERGVNLSGGEKQRLALARGIFFARDSDIVLLDEPTSSLDQVTERKVYANLLKIFADKCVVSSVHKLHLLDMFDEVYVFSQGRLIERGSPFDLRNSGGALSQMIENSVNNSELVLAE